MVFYTFFNLCLNIPFLCLSIGARLPPTTPSGCGVKTHNLRTVALNLCLAFHMHRWVVLIKSLKLSFLIWKMGTMMIIPPSRLHVCLLRTSGPEWAFWVPKSGQIWIILLPGEKEIFCLEVMAAIVKAKYCFKPNDIYFWTMTQNSNWSVASGFWVATRANYYWLRLLPSSALPVIPSLSTTYSLELYCKESCKALVSCWFPISPA